MFEGYESDERRRYPRKQVSHSTNIMSAETRNVLGECFLTNVSGSGIAIESDCSFSIGQKVLIKINILSDVIVLAGEIVRTDRGFFDPLYGIRISEQESVNLDVFRSYVSHQLN